LTKRERQSFVAAEHFSAIVASKNETGWVWRNQQAARQRFKGNTTLQSTPRSLSMKKTFFAFIKRDLILGVSLSALVFGSALALGGPFIAANRPHAAASAQVWERAATFGGTLLCKGTDVYLNDQAGNVYQLSNVTHASQFEGRYVIVKGNLNPRAKRLHVERISTITA
jgi:hypothetical protein